jgi:hypothetical protein
MSGPYDDLYRLAHLLENRHVGLVEYSLSRLVVAWDEPGKPGEIGRAVKLSLDLNYGMIPWTVLERALPGGAA